LMKSIRPTRDTLRCLLATLSNPFMPDYTPNFHAW
jgi:hypothetical protein